MTESNESRIVKLLEETSADAKVAARAARESAQEARSANTNAGLAHQEAKRANLRITSLEAKVEKIDQRVGTLEAHDPKSAKDVAAQAKIAAEEARRISQAEGLEADAHRAETLVAVSKLEAALEESRKQLVESREANAKQIAEAREEFRRQKRSRRMVNFAGIGTLISSTTAAAIAIIYAVRSPIPSPVPHAQAETYHRAPEVLTAPAPSVNFFSPDAGK